MTVYSDVFFLFSPRFMHLWLTTSQSKMKYGTNYPIMWEKGSSLAGAWLKSNLTLISPNPLAGSNRGFKSYFRDIALTPTHKHTHPTQSCQFFIKTVTATSIRNALSTGCVLASDERLCESKMAAWVNSAPWLMSWLTQSTDNKNKYRAIRREVKIRSNENQSQKNSKVYFFSKFSHHENFDGLAETQSGEVCPTTLPVWTVFSVLQSSLYMGTLRCRDWNWWQTETHSRRQTSVSSDTSPKHSQHVFLLYLLISYFSVWYYSSSSSMMRFHIILLFQANNVILVNG